MFVMRHWCWIVGDSGKRQMTGPGNKTKEEWPRKEEDPEERGERAVWKREKGVRIVNMFMSWGCSQTLEVAWPRVLMETQDYKLQQDCARHSIFPHAAWLLLSLHNLHSLEDNRSTFKHYMRLYMTLLSKPAMEISSQRTLMKSFTPRLCSFVKWVSFVRVVWQ